MSTASLLDELVPQADENYSRSTGNNSLLKLIEKGQDKLFDYDSAYMQWVGTENLGWPPYLTTVAGTTRYEISAANLTDVTAITRGVAGSDRTVLPSRVLKVFVDATNIDYGKRWVGRPYLFSWSNAYSTAISRMDVADIPVNSYPAFQNTNPYIEFLEDPGDSTEKYFVLFTWKPQRLISENIPLFIPEEFEEAIEDYVIGTIQKRSHGKESDRLIKFQRIWKRDFQRYITSLAKTSPSSVTPRFC